MSDRDILPFRGIPYFAVVDDEGVAVDGTADIKQLAYRGMRPICEVNSAGVSENGVTLAQLKFRGIEGFCPVDENGASEDAVTIGSLHLRGVPAMCKVDTDGVAVDGTATIKDLQFRGIRYFCPLGEDGDFANDPLPLQGVPILYVRADQGATAAQWDDRTGNGNHLVQGTAAKQMIKTTGFGGKPCMRTSLTSHPDEYFDLPAGLSTDKRSHSYWCVFRTRSVIQGAARCVVSFGPNTTDCFANLGLSDLSAPNEWQLRDSGGAKYPRIRGRSDLSLIIVSASASGVDLEINGEAGSVAAFAAGSLTGGRAFRRADGQPIGGEVYEFGLLNRAMTSDEKTTLRAYAQSYYGRVWPSTKQVVIDGDSLTEGQEAVTSLGWPALLDDDIGDQFRIISQGTSARLASQSYTDRAKTALYYNAGLAKNVYVIPAGTNDLNNSVSAVDLMTSIAGTISTMSGAGFYTIACTVPKRNGGTWDGTKETQRTTFNANLLGGGSGANVVVDLAALPVFADPTNLTYYAADQIHWADAAFVAAKDAIKTAVLAA